MYTRMYHSVHLSLVYFGTLLTLELKSAFPTLFYRNPRVEYLALLHAFADALFEVSPQPIRLHQWTCPSFSHFDNTRGPQSIIDYKSGSILMRWLRQIASTFHIVFVDEYTTVIRFSNLTVGSWDLRHFKDVPSFSSVMVEASFLVENSLKSTSLLALANTFGFLHPDEAPFKTWWPDSSSENL